MSLSPEIKTIPGMIGKFGKAGLTFELIDALLQGQTKRNLLSDAKRFIEQYEQNDLIRLNGLENLPKRSGMVIAFNHPNMDVLLPGMLKLAVKINEETGAQPKILMGAEIPLTARFNKSSPVPGSASFMKRFHDLYSDNIISVPMSKNRTDYFSGRVRALKRAISFLKNGDIVIISPEGHVEMNNEISPLSTFHDGSGGLAVIASKENIPVIPVGFWQKSNPGKIEVNIGSSFSVANMKEHEASIEVMRHVALTLPKELRGPFSK